jgi:hypothetical protein
MSRYAFSTGWGDSERKSPSTFCKQTLFFVFNFGVLIIGESSTPSEMNGALPPLSNTQPMTITSFQSTFVHVYDWCIVLKPHCNIRYGRITISTPQTLQWTLYCDRSPSAALGTKGGKCNIICWLGLLYRAASYFYFMSWMTAKLGSLLYAVAVYLTILY